MPGEQEIATLEKDTVIKVNGIPLQLVNDTKIQTNEANMPLIEEALSDLNASAPVPNLMEAVSSGLTCEAADEHKYGVIMAPVPREVRDLILKDLVPQIPFEDLATDEKGTMFGAETDSHITVLYGLTDFEESQAALKKFFKKPLKMRTTGKIKYFDNDNSVAYLEIESEDLEALHADLAYLSEVPNPKKYIPHCTIAYIKADARLPVDKVEPFEWEVSKLILSLKDDDRIEVGLGGDELEELVKVVGAALKTYAGNSDFCGWIDPEGHSNSVPFGDHAIWAFDNIFNGKLKMNGKPLKRETAEDFSDYVQKSAYNLGWARISHASNVSALEASDRITEEAFTMGMEFLRYTISDITDANVTVDIMGFSESVWNKVEFGRMVTKFKKFLGFN